MGKFLGRKSLKQGQKLKCLEASRLLETAIDKTGNIHPRTPQLA